MNLMSVMERGECVVTLETPEGMIFTGKAAIAELNLHQDVEAVYEFGSPYRQHVPTQQHWDINLVGMGELMASTEYTERVAEKATAAYWTCPYCGRHHDRTRLKCWDGRDGCGATRPTTGVADVR